MKRWSMIALGAAILGGAYGLSTNERDFDPEEGMCSNISEDDATALARQYLAEELDTMPPLVKGEGSAIADFEVVRFPILEGDTNIVQGVVFKAPSSQYIYVWIYSNCSLDFSSGPT